MSFMAGTLLCVPVFAQLPSAADPSAPRPTVGYPSVSVVAAADEPRPTQGKTALAELLAQPLQADAAVRIALLNNPKLQTAQDVEQLAAHTRKAWIYAVAAQQSARYLRDATEAAEAGAELARRMARSGNWSRLEQAREQLFLSDATTQLARAEHKAYSEREKLTRLLGLQTGFTLAERLPGLPTAASAMDDIAAHETPQSREAYLGYRAAYDLAVHYRDDVVPLHKLIQEEMVLRYSGMLASVWELLADTRQQILAVNEALEAQRDFWLAEADLQTALGGTTQTPTPQGH